MKEKCPWCPKQYQSEKDLDEHLKKIHGLSIADIKKRTEKEKSEFVKQCKEILDEIKQGETNSLTNSERRKNESACRMPGGDEVVKSRGIKECSSKMESPES